MASAIRTVLKVVRRAVNNVQSVAPSTIHAAFSGPGSGTGALGAEFIGAGSARRGGQLSPWTAPATARRGASRLPACAPWTVWCRHNTQLMACRSHGHLPFQRFCYPQLPTAGDIQRCGVICAAQDERAPFSGRHFSDAIIVTWCPVQRPWAAPVFFTTQRVAPDCAFRPTRRLQ